VPAVRASEELPDAPDAAVTHSARINDDGKHPVTREVTWRTLPGAFVHDQKSIWLIYPKGVATGHHWIPTLAIAGGTAALIYADPHVARYFRDNGHANHLDKINDAFDPLITTAEVIAVPASLLAFGYARHDNYQVDTAIECALSYGDSAIVDLAIKAITRRQRPADVEQSGSFTGTFFNSGKSPLKGSSFPSGHAAGAFSVATVVAGRYGNHKWVPPLVYALATAISFSRVTTNAHFTSDVFLGGALGYTVAKYQVLRPQ
jgi:membrane-associated phospholipid phosphatase